MNGDYHIKITVKNGHLYRAIRAAGYKSALQFSEDSGICYPSINKLLNMTRSPRRMYKPSNKKCNGGWRKCSLDIAAYLNVEVEYLFPEHLIIELPSNSIELFSDSKQLSECPTKLLSVAPDCFDFDQTQDLVGDAMDKVLTDREKEVVIMRFGFDGHHLHSLKEVGVKLCVGRERVRQIEARALRKLRHPNSMRIIEGVTSDERTSSV